MNADAGQRDKALVAFREVRPHPETPVGMYNLTGCLVRVGRRPEALIHPRRAGELGYTDAD